MVSGLPSGEIRMITVRYRICCDSEFYGWSPGSGWGERRTSEDFPEANQCPGTTDSPHGPVALRGTQWGVAGLGLVATPGWRTAVVHLSSQGRAGVTAEGCYLVSHYPGCPPREKARRLTHAILLFWKERGYKCRDDGGGCFQGYI